MPSEVQRARRRRARLEHAAILIGGGAGYVAASWALTSVAPDPARWPLAGMLAVGGVVMAVAIHLVHGAGGARFATDAERHSSRALRRMDGWRVVDDVPFGGMNIDHVAVGRQGVVAVETTHLPVAMPVGDDGDDPMEHALRRARKGARRVRLLLKSVGIDADVAPALAVWGRGTATVPFEAADGVAVLAGGDRRRWRAHLPDTGQRLPDELVERIASELARFGEMRRETRARPA